MILEVPDKYVLEFIGFLELGLAFLDMRKSEMAAEGRRLELDDDEVAVMEIVKDFIESHSQQELDALQKR